VKVDVRTADRSAPRLVGVPGEGLDVRPIPKAPGGDLGLADVEFVAMPMRTPSGDPTSLFAGLWERMTSLRYVQVPSAGVDWIIGDIPPGVDVCSARGVHDIPVSEWVLAAVLAGLKDLGRFRDDMHEGRWASEDLPELSGANVLLLGYGSIAHAVERRLEPFEPKSIVRLARHAREGVLTMDALPGVLPAADVVVVLLPLTAETRGLVGTDFLAAMKPGALLVNAARGKIVDTAALLEALRTGRIRAVLDVTDPEPLPADDPLWRAPGLLVTPHIAGASERLAARIIALVRAQLERFARDEPLENVVREGY
jgi:phosphoglycerate dehydrogenase-like enzyme